MSLKYISAAPECPQGHLQGHLAQVHLQTFFVVEPLLFFDLKIINIQTFISYLKGALYY